MYLGICGHNLIDNPCSLSHLGVLCLVFWLFVFETGFRSIVLDVLELRPQTCSDPSILSSGCWDLRHRTPHLALACLKIY